MDIQVSPNDKISYIEIAWNKKVTEVNLASKSGSGSITRTYSTGSSTPKEKAYGDTVHYLSPATTPARTECEGDLYYQHFLELPSGFVSPGADAFPGTASTTTISCDEPELQRTLAIIKPDGLEYKDVVLRAVTEAGLKILSQRLLHLTPEQVSEIYLKHYGSPSFPQLVVTMSISPLLVLSLAGKNAVEKWKTMIGPYGQLREEWFFPYSVRTRFGIQSDMPEVIHASETIMEAKWENRYFFPRSIIEPITMEEEKVTDYIKNCISPTLLDGLIQVVKMKPINPILFLAEWLLLNNPYQPKFPERIAVSPL